MTYFTTAVSRIIDTAVYCKKYLFLLAIYVAISCTAQPLTYSRVCVFFDSTHTLKQVAEAGIETEHGDWKRDHSLTTDLSSDEIQRLQALGFRLQILIPDVANFYALQNMLPALVGSRAGSCATTSPAAIATPANFKLGSMGGYFTYQQLLNELDSMQAKYPHLISVRQQIDTFKSIEGRPIYWIKVSDNPTQNEGEPQILFTSLHHAREPAGMMSMIFYLWYVLENYATNPQIKALLDNTELYYVPCVNPDGYVYNQTTNPNGGGMWRKNRRKITNNIYGVDLNRNYGFKWGLDNTGSSSNPASETYRGTAPFSEPETRAMKWLCEHHQFKIALNYHTYGNLLIYPWGYTYSTLTPDSAVFVAIGEELTRVNHYVHGTGNQTVGYIVNGDSDDWMYGEQNTKNKILSMTPEAGHIVDGFWPASAQIVPICLDNFPIINGAHLFLLRYVSIVPTSSLIISNRNFNFRYQVKVLGFDTACTYRTHLESPDAFVTLPTTLHTWATPRALQSRLDSFSISLSNAITRDTIFRLVVVTDNGLFAQRDTVSCMFVTGDTIYYNSCSDNHLFARTGTWGITNETHTSPSMCLADSPNDFYTDQSISSATVIKAIDLTHALSAKLLYHTRYSIEGGYDFVAAQVKTDSDPNWQLLCSSLPLYDPENGYTGNQNTWVTEFISLNEYLGQKIYLRWQITSDQALTKDGIYIDDITVLGKIDSSKLNILAEEELPTDLRVFPNPSTGLLHIQGADSDAQVIVYDVMGAIVWKGKPTLQKINLQELPAGMYQVTITQSSQHYLWNWCKY